MPPDEASDHQLGPIRLDPLTNQHEAKCSCGERIGPVLNAGMVHAAFAAHVRRATGTTPPS